MNRCHTSVWLAIAIFFSLLALPAISHAEPQEKITSLACLKFNNQNDQKYDWISTAIPDSIIGKLSGTRNLHLIEREYISSLLKNHKGSDDEKLSMLIGSDWILMGSFTIIENNIRINARVVQSEKSRIIKSSIIKCDGRLDQLLSLQTELAIRLSEVCELQLGRGQLEYQEGANIRAHQLFNQGKVQFYAGKFAGALQSFLSAQQENEGLYFAEAHTWEGLSRSELANQQTEPNKKSIIQSRHIEKFEKDAAEASHALFDLGRAFQATSKYTQAIQAYDHFLKWVDDNARPFLWARKAHEPLHTEVVDGYYAHGKIIHDQAQTWLTKKFAYRHWYNDGQDLFFLVNEGDDKHLAKANINNGKTLWSTSIGETNFRNVLKVNSERVYLVTNEKLFILNRLDGKIIKTIQLQYKVKSNNRFMSPSLLIYEDPQIAIVKHSTLGQHLNMFEQQITAIDLNTGKVLWEQIGSYRQNRLSVGAWKNQIIIFRDRKVELLEPATGKTKIFLSRLGDKYPVQYWPAKDHLLIRFSANPRLGKGDIYYKWFPEKKRQEKCVEKIFFSHFYNQTFKGHEQYKIPLIDLKSKQYRLIPAKWIFPYTIFRGMDIYDAAPGDGTNAYYTSKHARVVLDGKNLWLSNRKYMVFQLDSTKGTLLWKTYVSASGGGLSSHGRKILVRNVEYIRCYHATNEQLGYRSIEAMLNQSQCYDKLGQKDQAIEILRHVLSQDAKNFKAHEMLAQLYEKKGQLFNTSYHYDCVTRFSSTTYPGYKKSFSWLEKNTGLLYKRKVHRLNGLATFKKNLLIQDQDILKNVSFPDQTEITLSTSPGQWVLSGNNIFICDQNSGQLTAMNLNAQLWFSKNLEIKSNCFSICKKRRGSFSYWTKNTPFAIFKDLIIYATGEESHELCVYNWKTETMLFKQAIPHHTTVDFNNDYLIAAYKNTKLRKTNHPLRPYTHTVTAYNLKSTSGNVGDEIWTVNLPETGNTGYPQVQCAILDNEIAIFTNDFDRSINGKFWSTATLDTLDLVTGERLQRSIMKDFIVENIYEGYGLIMLNVWKKNFYRICVPLTEGMKGPDILASIPRLSFGVILPSPDTKHVYLIGRHNPKVMNTTSNKINIMDAENGEILSSTQAFAAIRSRNFRVNEHLLAFNSDSYLYVFDTKKFLKFMLK